MTRIRDWEFDAMGSYVGVFIRNWSVVNVVQGSFQVLVGWTVEIWSGRFLNLCNFHALDILTSFFSSYSSTYYYDLLNEVYEGSC